MRYVVDHDLHIHSQLSPCSSDPGQTIERIFQYGVENKIKHICVADHFWDETLPTKFYWEGYDLLSKALPLPQGEGTTFHFGCEADMDWVSTVGITKKTAEKFDFIIVPTSHLHMSGKPEDDNATRKQMYIDRWETLLNSDLPFCKMGLAHITCNLIAGGRTSGDQWVEHLNILDSIPDETFKRLFAKTEKLGMGVEINEYLSRYQKHGLETYLRIYKIAIECGCHFYFGSDAHHPNELNGGPGSRFEEFVDLLKLEEDQKFKPQGFVY